MEPSRGKKRCKVIVAAVALIMGVGLLVYFGVRGNIVALVVSGVLAFGVLVALVYSWETSEPVTYLGDVPSVAYPIEGKLDVDAHITDRIRFTTQSGAALDIPFSDLATEGGFSRERTRFGVGPGRILLLTARNEDGSTSIYRFKCSTNLQAQAFADLIQGRILAIGAERKRAQWRSQTPSDEG